MAPVSKTCVASLVLEGQALVIMSTQAEVAELVDALALGASGGYPVRVRVSPFAAISFQRQVW